MWSRITPFLHIDCFGIRQAYLKVVLTPCKKFAGHQVALLTRRSCPVPAASHAGTGQEASMLCMHFRFHATCLRLHVFLHPGLCRCAGWPCFLAAAGNHRQTFRRALPAWVAVHTPIPQEPDRSAGPSYTTGINTLADQLFLFLKQTCLSEAKYGIPMILCPVHLQHSGESVASGAFAWRPNNVSRQMLCPCRRRDGDTKGK